MIANLAFWLLTSQAEVLPPAQDLYRFPDARCCKCMVKANAHAEEKLRGWAQYPGWRQETYWQGVEAAGHSRLAWSTLGDAHEATKAKYLRGCRRSLGELREHIGYRAYYAAEMPDIPWWALPEVK